MPSCRLVHDSILKLLLSVKFVCVCACVCEYTCLVECVYVPKGYIGKPYSSRNNGISFMCLQKFTYMYRSRVITYTCFRMCVHHANNYQSSLLTVHIWLVRTFITKNSQSSLLMLHIRLVLMFIAWRVTMVVYWHL